MPIYMIRSCPTFLVHHLTAIDPALTVESRDFNIFGVRLRDGSIHAPSQDRFSLRLLIFFV
jgi:hypothetical protein